MKLFKVINNNVVSVCDESGVESIVTGRGVGFQKKPGDAIDSDRVEKVFRLDTRETTESLRELLREVPLDVMNIAEYAIQQAKTVYRKKLNDSVYVTLTDHLNFAIERAHKGMYIRNELLWDIQKLYRDEYRIGLDVLDKVEETLSIRLPEDEAGFIALHLVTSEWGEAVNTTKNITTLIQDLLKIVKYQLGVEWDDGSLHYSRFVTHLTFFARRMFAGETFDHGGDADMYAFFKDKPSFKCTEKMAQFLYSTHEYVLSKEERVYLAIHLERLLKGNSTK